MTIVRRAASGHRIKTWPIIAALILTISPAWATSTDRYERAVAGQWRLTAALDGADVASLDEKEARQLVGKVFTISKQSVKFGDRTQSKPEAIVSGVDVVLDTVGGPATGRFLQVLKPGGALYPVYPLGFTGAEDAAKAGYIVSTTQVRSNGAQLAQAARLLEDGTVCVSIDSRFPLRDAYLAHARAARGHLRGKIVLTVEDDA